jgi:REP element-mobilizing transposase RayT
MPRQARVAPGGLVYHVLNRSVAGPALFRKEADFEAFERITIEAHQRHPIRILAWCMMLNHWHFILWLREDGELAGYRSRSDLHRPKPPVRRRKLAKQTSEATRAVAHNASRRPPEERP